MNEEALRRLVREAIARQRAGSAGEFAPVSAETSFRLHPSHGMFRLTAGADADSLCLIEPAVTCNHCGYCKSWGH